jgi:hypothetical protein
MAEYEPPRPIEVHGLGGNRRRLERQRRGAAHAGLISEAAAAEAAKGELTFVQISDSHTARRPIGEHADRPDGRTRELEQPRRG